MPCGTVRLCGISSRFQLLSPGAGQVIHALLTRPPLSHFSFLPEGVPVKCFVRLACVRHAASVHPEPGSNSQIKVLFHSESIWLILCFLITVFSRSLSRFLVSAVCLNLFSFESFKVISLFSYQGSGPLQPLFSKCFSRGQLDYTIMSVSLCQPLFLLFLNLLKI